MCERSKTTLRGVSAWRTLSLLCESTSPTILSMTPPRIFEASWTISPETGNTPLRLTSVGTRKTMGSSGNFGIS